MRNGMLALSFFASVGTALAADVGGIKVDDKATVGGKELVLNGAGIRTRLFIKVYVGALYVAQKTSSVQEILNSTQPRRMSMMLQRDISSDTLLEALRAGLADNNSQAELDSIVAQIDQFVTIFHSVGEAKAGQLITIDYAPGDGTRVALDGAAKGTISGEGFGRALFKTWLGDKPVQDSLKKALLGAG